MALTSRARAAAAASPPPSAPPPVPPSAASAAAASAPPLSPLGIFMRDFAGGRYLRFFRVPPRYVDTRQAPGFSPLPPPSATDWLTYLFTLRHMWGTLNIVWASIALALYLAFPYDLSPASAAASAPLSAAFFAERFPLWFAVTFGYNAFWHVTLYAFGWADRPFLPGRAYNAGKVAHNAFWSLCGVAMWVAFENVFAFLWASGRLPYMSDADAFASPSGVAKFVAGFILVPAWRDLHFYASHRLLHLRPFFAPVHSLHHRNQDVEPFSGLSMHPMEHLAYFSCVAPSLLPFLSPAHLLWNGAHLLLSPGASHSGYEDIAGGGSFHYLHHRYFECNYAGFGAAALDVAFGTFVSGFGARGEKPGALKQFGDAKASLRVAPPAEFWAYLLLAGGALAAWAYAACVPGGLAALAPLTPLHLSLLAGFGPLLAAAALPGSWVSGTPLTDARGAPLQHLAVGLLVTSVPIAYAAHLCF
jgi:sterol desaturase/sphingolipid hydroxylase (fatty acid hydroxylase superfamily)